VVGRYGGGPNDACGPRTLWFVTLKRGEGLGGGVGDLGGQPVVMSAPGSLGRFDGEGVSGMDDADADPLQDDEDAAAVPAFGMRLSAEAAA
jgi:hypothetical protein